MPRLLLTILLSAALATPLAAQETTAPAQTPRLQETKTEEAKPKAEERSPFLELRSLLFPARRSHAELRGSDVLRDGANFGSRGTGRFFDR